MSCKRASPLTLKKRHVLASLQKGGSPNSSSLLGYHCVDMHKRARPSALLPHNNESQ